MVSSGPGEVRTYDVLKRRLFRGYVMPTDPEELYRQMRDQGHFSPSDIGALARLLWEHHGEDLLLFARGRLKNIEDARDVCQDAILSAIEWLYRNKGSYSGTIKYGAWLTTIAQHKITDRLRGSGRETPWSALAPPSSDADGESFLDGIKSEEPDPMESLCRKEDLARLRQCVKNLRPEWLRALVLFYCKHLTYKQIAETTNMGINTVGVVLHRTVGQLRECMGVTRTA